MKLPRGHEKINLTYNNKSNEHVYLPLQQQVQQQQQVLRQQLLRLQQKRLMQQQQNQVLVASPSSEVSQPSSFSNMEDLFNNTIAPNVNVALQVSRYR